MRIEERAASDPGVTALVEAAYAELVAKYGASGRSGVHPDARFLVAVDDARPGDEAPAIGCAALQPTEVPGTAELKRMYVAPGSRGRGAARAILAAIEDLARSSGYGVIRLSTGDKQPEAMALYESSGYSRTVNYPKYAARPEVTCYAKRVGEPAVPHL